MKPALQVPFMILRIEMVKVAVFHSKNAIKEKIGTRNNANPIVMVITINGIKSTTNVSNNANQEPFMILKLKNANTLVIQEKSTISEMVNANMIALLIYIGMLTVIDVNHNAQLVISKVKRVVKSIVKEIVMMMKSEITDTVKNVDQIVVKITLNLEINNVYPNVVLTSN